MRIEGLLAAYSPETLRSPAGGRRVSDKGGESSPTTQRKGDIVQISEEARRRLERVRQRIEGGYYNSESVTEDISDKLSGVLDRLEP